MRSWRPWVAAVCVTGAAVGLVLAATASPSPRAPAAFTITKLQGELFKRNGLYWVRLEATLCDPTPDRGGTYPTAMRISHYLVTKHRTSWWAARTVVDHPPYLVPLGETWGGKPCGPVTVDDPIPSEHYGVESLGNPLGCYAAGLTIVAGSKHASRRAIVTCKPRF